MCTLGVCAPASVSAYEMPDRLGSPFRVNPPKLHFHIWTCIFLAPPLPPNSIIGDSRRVALYGVDQLITWKQEDFKELDKVPMLDEVLRAREEITDQIKALKELKGRSFCLSLVCLSYSFVSLSLPRYLLILSPLSFCRRFRRLCLVSLHWLRLVHAIVARCARFDASCSLPTRFHAYRYNAPTHVASLPRAQSTSDDA